MTAMNPQPNRLLAKLSAKLLRSLSGSVLLAAGLCLCSCADKAKPAANGSDPTGVYTLIMVNGTNIPTTISHEGAKLEVRSGTFTINADGTCISKMVFVPPSGTEATREVKAKYTRDGATMNMQWEGAGTTTGTIEGNTFSMNNEGMVLTYRK